MNEIIVLNKHDGWNQVYHIIKESELKKWLEDGSLEEGDRIVYPNKIMNVILNKKLELLEAKK